MFIWSLVLFGLGILAVLDSQFNYGYLFRSANSLVFMLVSLGVLVRTRMLEKFGIKEQLIESNRKLKTQVNEMKQSETQVQQRETRQEVTV